MTVQVGIDSPSRPSGVLTVGAVTGSFVQNLGEVGATHIHFTFSYFAQIFHPSIENTGLGSPLTLSNQLGLVVSSATGILAVVHWPGA